MAGLLLWGGYLLVDEDRLAWATIADMGLATLLGLTMAWRWIRVYRAPASPAPSPTTMVTVPPERHFPLSAVILHGILAVTTIALVLFTVLVDS